MGVAALAALIGRWGGGRRRLLALCGRPGPAVVDGAEVTASRSSASGGLPGQVQRDASLALAYCEHAAGGSVRLRCRVSARSPWGGRSRVCVGASAPGRARGGVVAALGGGGAAVGVTLRIAPGGPPRCGWCPHRGGPSCWWQVARFRLAVWVTARGWTAVGRVGDGAWLDCGWACGWTASGWTAVGRVVGGWTPVDRGWWRAGRGEGACVVILRFEDCAPWCAWFY
jgi:hypothetical protein